MYLINNAKLLLAGNCIFTAKSEVTNTYFTYKITQDKFDKHKWYVRTLMGNNINNPRDYYYLGIIRNLFIDEFVGYAPDVYFELTLNSCCNASDLRVKAIKYIVDSLPELPRQVTLYHNCRCARCGRRLTSPESIKLGIGKDCLKSLQG